MIKSSNVEKDNGAIADIISHLHCICLLTNENGESIRKIFGEELANKWKLNIIFTGTQDECLEFIKSNNY